MANTQETTQIATTLFQLVQEATIKGQNSEVVTGLKQWLVAITRNELIVMPAITDDDNEEEVKS